MTAAFDASDSQPRTYVHRPRLLSMLSRAAECKLTIVCANAGYGKTCLMTEFIRSTGLPAQWYNVTGSDRDATRLADSLEDCLRQLSKEAVPTTAPQQRSRQGDPSGVSLSEALLRQASRVDSRSAILILDDYQNVDREEEVNSLLGSLIERSPSQLHFVVMSRSAPRFSLAKLMARQEVLTVGEDDLAFTLEEVAHFLRVECEIQIDDESVALVHSRTEGWAAGVAMVAQSLRYGRQGKVMDILSDPVKSAWLVYEYLAEEVFDRVEAPIQDFLVKTSVLHSMTRASCNHLLETKRSHETLMELEDRGLFTTAADSSRTVFRYHQLFHEFLRQKLYQREALEAIEELHLRAAQYAEQQQDWEECVFQYLRAGQPVLAAQIVEKVGERYIFAGLSQTVEYWLRALPEQLTTTRPWLLALRGRLSLAAVRFDESLRMLERALWLFERGEDAEGQAWVEGEIGYVKTRMGALEQATFHLDSALKLASPGTMLRSRLFANEAITFRDAGRLEDAAAACRSAVGELAAVEDRMSSTWCFSRATRILAHAHMEMGLLDAALKEARETVAYCTRNQIGEYEESYALATLGAVLWSRGQFDEAIEVCQRALSLSLRYVQQLRDFTAHWLGNSLRDSGRHSEAETIYEGTSREVLLERAYTLILSGRSAAAKRSVDELYRWHKQSEDVTERSTSEVLLAAVLRDSGDLEGALTHIKKGAQLLSDHGHKLRLCSALLHQLRIEYELLRPADARTTLSHMLDLASANGYYHFFWWDPRLVEFACGKALSEGLHVEYATELAVRRLDTTNATTFVPLLQHRRPEVKRQAQSVLSSLPQRASLSLKDVVLSDCADPSVRDALVSTAGEGVLPLRGMQILRAKFALSWREIEILVEYYLRPASRPVSDGEQLRKSCALRMNISENTVRCHVTNLRSKLGLPKSVSGKQVLVWAEEEGLFASPAVVADPPGQAEPTRTPRATDLGE